MKAPEIFHIRPYKLAELARIYRVNKRTMKSWLKPFAEEIGKPVGHFYLCNQVRIIKKCIGEPDEE